MKKLLSALLALVIVGSFSVFAFAKTPSPTATTATTATTTKKGNTTTKDYNTGKVTITKDPNSDEITYTFDPNSGFDFSSWKITGGYTIVSGSLESGTITIIPDDPDSIKVVPVAKESTETTTKDDGDGQSSPKTSDNSVYLILVGALALGAVVISKKKLAK